MLVLAAIWAWLKKYWKWLLFPVGLLLGAISMWSRRRNVDVVAPEVLEAEKARVKAELEAQERAQQAEVIRKAKVEFIERNHAETIGKLTDGQKTKVDELRKDPDKLNDFLLNVGEEIRG